MLKKSVSAILIDKSNVPDEFDLKPFFDETVRKIRELTDDITVLSDEKFEGLKSVNFKTSYEFLEFLSKQHKDNNILILNAYSPLLSLSATRKMLTEQEEMVFDYTYPENLPEGLVPEVITGEIAGFIKETVPRNLPLFLKSVKEAFESDLSSYDTNIYIEPGRLIKYRVNFLPDSLNDAMATKDIMSHGTDWDISSLEKFINDNPLIIRQRPTYYEIQLTSERESGKFFLSDLTGREGQMKTGDFENIISQIARFSYNPVVMLGFLCEPFLHPEIDEILNIIERYSDIRFIFESRSIITNYEPVKKALAIKNVRVIFDISFARDENFAVYKKPFQSILPFESLTNTEAKIKALTPAEKVFIQFTRSTVNESEIMKFYEKWADYRDRIIIKKIDTFNGALDEYKSVDLAPIEGSFSLHLKHDIYILSDGTVALNRCDPNAQHAQGNILSDGIEDCWAKQGELYQQQWESNFTEPGYLYQYDDWWVFNF